MTMTYEELKAKTLAELREIAKDIVHDAVRGYSQMNKERLLPAICQALGIETREHHEVVRHRQGRHQEEDPRAETPARRGACGRGSLAPP